MTELRVGVIGLGMGKGHVHRFQDHPNAKVVAVADLNEELLKKVADEFGVDGRYTDAEAMVGKEKLDIVCVATPNTFHKPLTLMALAGGCHVLCEKPIAMNAGEAREMTAAAKSADRRLMINFSTRFNEAAWIMKREVESGAIGDIYFARTCWLRRRGMPRFGGWFGQKKMAGGGPLIDLGVHRLDLALWLMDYPKPTWVMGSTYDHVAQKIAKAQGKDYDVEDYAVALIKFENGATVELEASWAGHMRQAEFMETRIMGTEGGMIHNNPYEDQPYRFESEMYTDRNGYQFNSKPAKSVEPVPSSMMMLVDCILEDKPHMATGEEGLIVQELLDAIYLSAEKGEPIKISDS